MKISVIVGNARFEADDREGADYLIEHFGRVSSNGSKPEVTISSKSESKPDLLHEFIGGGVPAASITTVLKLRGAGMKPGMEKWAKKKYIWCGSWDLTFKREEKNAKGTYFLTPEAMKKASEVVERS